MLHPQMKGDLERWCAKYFVLECSAEMGEDLLKGVEFHDLAHELGVETVELDALLAGLYS
jgi:hypothetical protein